MSQSPFWEPESLSSFARRAHFQDDQSSVTEQSEGGYLGRALGERQLWLAAGLLAVTLLTLVLRAFMLQAIQGESYRGLAEGNRVRVKTTLAPRGIIYDRYGRALTGNLPRLSIVLVPNEVPRDDTERERVFSEASAAAGIEIESFEQVWQALSKSRKASVEPEIVVTDLPLEEAAILSVRLNGLSGVEVLTTPLRAYAAAGSEAKSLGHLLGYVGSPADKEIDLGYTSVDVVGRSGVERSFESVVRGQNGRREVEVNALGEEQQLVSETSASSGWSLWLTVDAELQRVVEEAMARGLTRAGARRGAAVVLDPRDGAVLASVSLPTFDAAAFSRGLSAEEYQALQSNTDNPLFNRVTQGLYPSGSTIKPVIAAAALEEGVITRSTTYSSVGGLSVGGSFFPDWKAGGHGIVDVRRAIAESVNTFFYIIGGGYQDAPGLGIERLERYARLFGLGSATGIDLPEEANGLVPSPSWKEKVKGERWYIGDTYHAAIGQGDVLVTPLQVARYTAAFANGGKLYRPHLKLEAVSSNGEKHDRYITEASSQQVVSDETLRIVREGMRQVVTSGSAQSLNSLRLAVAGKTGTAELGGRRTPHAWFTGFAPYDEPEIVVTILLEESGEGSTYAVPVAAEVLRWWADNRSDR